MPIIYLFFPETKGLELEAVDHIFTASDPVKASFEAEKGRVVVVEEKEQVFEEGDRERKRVVEEVEG